MNALRWFRLGSYGLIVLAVIHFISNRSGLPIHVDDAAGRELVRLMSTYEISFFGVRRTMNATVGGFILIWGGMLLAIATINLALSGRHPHAAPPASLRVINAATWTVCLFAAIIYWSWPQALLFAAITTAFVLAVWPPRLWH